MCGCCLAACLCCSSEKMLFHSYSFVEAWARHSFACSVAVKPILKSHRRRPAVVPRCLYVVSCCMCFSQASLDRCVRLWDSRSLGSGTVDTKPKGMKPLVEMPHFRSVNSAHFSPTGEWLCTVGQDDKVKLFKDLAQANGKQVLMCLRFPPTNSFPKEDWRAFAWFPCIEMLFLKMWQDNRGGFVPQTVLCARSCLVDVLGDHESIANRLRRAVGCLYRASGYDVCNAREKRPVIVEREAWCLSFAFGAGRLAAGYQTNAWDRRDDNSHFPQTGLL